MALASLSAAVGLAGCGNAEDAKVEAGLASVASHRVAHPHYPLMLTEDYGSESQPPGIAVDAYGFYVHVSSKPHVGADALSQASAAKTVEHAIEKSIQAIVAQEAATPPPKPPLPTNPDWKNAPHPSQGTYTVVCRCGMKTRTFNYVPSKSGDSASLTAQLAPQISKDAAAVVADGLTAQNDALKALGTPPGFTLCTAELLKIQQGSRGVEPHLIGPPFLIVPIDKPLALKGVEHSIRKLLGSTAKIQPAPDTATVVVQGPDFDASYPVPLKPGDGQEKGISAALAGVGAKIEELNRKAS